MSVVQSPLQILREAEQRKNRRSHLKSAVLDAKQSIQQEREKKNQLSRVANDLASKVERLLMLADELEHTKSHHRSHSEMRDRVQESRMSHLSVSDDGLPTTQSMMLFNTASDVPHRQGPKGRSSRRTAYTTDYSGRRYPGVCEFQDANDKRLRAEALSKERHASRPPIELPKLDNRRNPAGHPHGGIFTLEGGRGRSSKRTRFYTDYEGDRIKMDPCNWPTESGVVLI